MSQVFNIPQASYPNGTTTIPKTALPANSTQISLVLNRCTTATPTIWPNSTTTIAVDLQISYDGGASFVAAGGFTSAGGIVHNLHGVDLMQSVGRWSLQAGATHVQGTLVIAGGPMLTSGSVDIV